MGYESRLKQKEDLTNDLEREVSYFKRKNYYDSDGLQNYLVFKVVSSSFKRSRSNNTLWKSTGTYDLNEDNDVSLTTVCDSSSIVPKHIIASENGKLNVRFSENLLKQSKIHYNHDKVLNIYIPYELRNRSNNNPDTTLENCLFGAVKITKDVNTSKYNCNGYGIGFNAGSSFSFGNNLNANIVIIFVADMSFSSH